VAERFICNRRPILGEFQSVSTHDEGYTQCLLSRLRDLAAGSAWPDSTHCQETRGVIVQILDRFVEARVKTCHAGKKGVIARRKPSD